MINVKIDKQDLDDLAKDIEDKKLRDVVVKAANQTINQTRTKAVEALSDLTGVGKNAIKKRILTFKATRSDPSATMLLSGRGIPLIAFQARKLRVKTHRGLRFGVTTTAFGARDVVEGAFMATMKSGKKGIFKRVRDSRLPIRELFGKSTASVFNKDSGLAAQLQAYASLKFRDNFLNGFGLKK